MLVFSKIRILKKKKKKEKFDNVKLNDRNNSKFFKCVISMVTLAWSKLLMKRDSNPWESLKIFMFTRFSACGHDLSKTVTVVPTENAP